MGTLLFIDRGEGVTQMRQVAVDESCRRQGVRGRWWLTAKS